MLLLGAVAAFLCFFRLADAQPTLGNDEAAYALVLDNMFASGDWLTPHYIPGTPAFDKPPLYTWLSALTYDWFADGSRPLPYRVWSAAFAVGCVLLTYLLGLRCIGRWVGCVAGLAMTLNTSFLHYHGARTGELDTALTFFICLAILLYTHRRDGTTGALVWAGVGIALGAACMIKPPVVGGFFLVLLSAHHLTIERGLPWPQRLRGPAIACFTCFAIAAPWHLYECAQYGWGFIDGYFLKFMLGRVTSALEGHNKSPLYYVEYISKSSAFYHAFLPAMIVGIVGWRRASGPRGLEVLLLLTLSLVGAMTVATSKWLWYVYPIFPLVSIAVATFLLESLPGAMTRWRCSRRLKWTGVAVALALLGLDARSALRKLPDTAPPYVPLMIHNRALPAISQGSGQLVLYRFARPDRFPDTSLGFMMPDVYYAPRLSAARRADTAGELKRFLADGLPLVILLPRKLAVADLRTEMELPDDAETGECGGYPVISCNDGLARLGICDVIER